MLVGCFTACRDNTDNPDDPSNNPSGELGEIVDYASGVKFNPDSGRAWAEVTVKLYVDGDTTHFNIDKSVMGNGLLKARYLGVNTPESTGQIEPWGKKASDFTKSKLSAATSIIIESDSSVWTPDSTGERYLVWVWYKTAEMTDYKCLNLEILQEGLARASKSSDTVYADACTTILNQSVNHQLYVFSKDKDPDFYYGSAIPITLKELKTNIESYTNRTVSFEGVIIKNTGTTAYVEEYDEETGLYFGMQVYYGYTLDYFGKEVLQVGNRVRIVGSVQYYEAGGTYQISDIFYDAMDPDNGKNIKLIESGHAAAYPELDADRLLNDKVSIEVTTVDDEGNESVETKTYDVGFLTMHSSMSLKNLTVTDVYTTKNEDSANYGALSITCVDENGTEIILRTVVLIDSSGATVTASAFPVGSVLNAKGIVDVYNGVYQLKIFTMDDISFISK